MTFVRTGSCAVVRDPVYQEAIDRTVLANVKQAPPMTIELSRAAALVGNSAHNNERYDYISNYLRINGILPPFDGACASAALTQPLPPLRSKTLGPGEEMT